MRTPRLLAGACLIVLTSSLASAQVLPDEANTREAVEHYLQGQEWLSAEQWDRAATAFTAAIKLHPLMTDAYYGLGKAYMGLERYTSAALSFQRCLEAARTLHGLRAKARVESDRVLLETVDEVRDTIRRRGDTSLRSRQLEEYASKLLRSRPSLGTDFVPPAPVVLALGSAHFRAGDRGRAEYYWKEAARLDTSLGEAWNNLAAIYAASGRRAEAEDAVANAERAGFRVNPRLKADIKALR